MKKFVFFILIIIVIAGVSLVGYSLFLSHTNARGALQVTSEPESKVYLNGEEIGRTPLCICGEDTVSEDFHSANLGKLLAGKTDENLLPVGEYTIRLVPVEGGFSEFQDKIIIGKGTLTVVDRTFGKGAGSTGSVIMLEKIENDDLALSVLSIPDGAHVSMDGQSLGQTPLKELDITPSDHELELSKSGYIDKGVRIKTVPGYRLIARIYLGVDEASITGRGTPVASDSAKQKETDSVEENTLDIARVLILETGTGFLRVRDDSSLAGSEVGRVTPGESYPLLGEKTGWYQIEYTDGKTGWISSEFAQKE